MNREPIHFIITGGTIDSFYDGVHDNIVPNQESVIPEYVKSLKMHQELIFTTACLKDSRELTQEDVQNIKDTIENSKAKRIIVTHGTYTMADTARYLKANLKRQDQAIVFTGAMVPIKGFSPSDGGFNLGFAVAEVERLDPGIYVCMNARTFDPNEVTKLIHEGRFISVFTDRDS